MSGNGIFSTPATFGAGYRLHYVVLLAITTVMLPLGGTEAMSQRPESPSQTAGQKKSTPAGLNIVMSGSGIRETKQDVLRTKAEFAAIWKKHSPHPAGPKVPAVDFKRQDVVAYFLGAKPTGGWSVAFGEIKIEADKATVPVIVTKPGPNTIVTMAFTQPCAIRSVPKLPKNVVFAIEERER